MRAKAGRKIFRARARAAGLSKGKRKTTMKRWRKTKSYKYW
nr:MAG: hypothetical protein [Microvirus sp.]